MYYMQVIDLLAREAVILLLACGISISGGFFLGVGPVVFMFPVMESVSRPELAVPSSVWGLEQADRRHSEQRATCVRPLAVSPCVSSVSSPPRFSAACGWASGGRGFSRA